MRLGVYFLIVIFGLLFMMSCTGCTINQRCLYNYQIEDDLCQDAHTGGFGFTFYNCQSGVNYINPPKVKDVCINERP